jgi:SPP1 family predicted phage head-tail adaptor
MADRLQRLDERFTFLTDVPLPIAVSAVTRVGTVATVDLGQPHGFNDGDYVEIAGAVPSAYNGEVQIDATDADSFTFTVSGNPATPATGTITALFKSDAQGGQGTGWRTHVTVSGHMHPLSASESLQAEAIQSIVRYEAEIEYRPDITPKMKLQWIPFRHTTPKVLEIHGVKDHPKFPRKRLLLGVGERAA